MVSSVLLVIASSIAFARCASVPIKPGKYCATAPVKGVGNACIIFDYESESKARLTYRFSLHTISIKYNDVSMSGNEVILKRRGHTEGPELFPYYKVGFTLNVTDDGLKMITKDGKSIYHFSSGTCTAAEGSGNCGATSNQQRRLTPQYPKDSDINGSYWDNPEPDHFQTKLAFFWFTILPYASAVFYDSSKYQDLVDSAYWQTYHESGVDRYYATIRLMGADDNLVSSLWSIQAELRYYYDWNEVHFVPYNNSNPTRVLLHHQ